jgi:hypothetical protein
VWGIGVKITAVETVHLSKVHPPFIFVLVHTDEGLVGLGQTADTRTAAVVHDLAARFLLGQNPLHVESLWNMMFDFAGFHGYSGAELRAISAIDIAPLGHPGAGRGAADLRPARRPFTREYPHLQHLLDLWPALRRRTGAHRSGRAGRGTAGRRDHLHEWSVFDPYARQSHGQSITKAQLKEGSPGSRRSPRRSTGGWR